MHSSGLNSKVIMAFKLSLLAACFAFLVHSDELSLGRNPLGNLSKTLYEMRYPSFLDIWFGDAEFKYVSDDGTVLRVENRTILEKEFLFSALKALWVTFTISTLGTFLAATLSIPFALLTASNIKSPKALSAPAKLVLDFSRSVHTLVFGLFFVGIVGLGPMAGILAIGAHSMGSFGKLFAESIETIDLEPAKAIQGVGASPVHTFRFGVIPALLPQFSSTYLYLWEFNTRDSTVLGLIGAGGLGLYISESISLFQWSRLTTLILIVAAFVLTFDWASRKIRARLL